MSSSGSQLFNFGSENNDSNGLFGGSNQYGSYPTLNMGTNAMAGEYSRCSGSSTDAKRQWGSASSRWSNCKKRVPICTIGEFPILRRGNA